MIAARRRLLLGTVITTALVIGGCGDDKATPPAPKLDDAFVSRIVPHQHVAAELAGSAAKLARDPAVRRLARSARAMRKRTLPALDDRLIRVPSGRLPDLGVSAQQAADEVTPQALTASRPIDAAFLTVMTRHDRGALALVRVELERGGDASVKASAQRLAAELTRELGALSKALQATARRTSAG